jgi:O-acetyl-ADP-ribose deacetylase
MEAGGVAQGRLPDRDSIERILDWEAVLRKPADSLFEWEPSRRRDDGVHAMPYVNYAPEFLDFIRALSEHGFVVPFDWPAWAEEGMAIQEDPTRLREADLRTIVRLFTLHVRADRFNEGHLAEAIERGWLLGLLQRLRVLAAAG